MSSFADPMAMLRLRAGQLVVLAYHQIGEAGCGGRVGTRNFAAHLELLARCCRITSLSEGLRLLREGRAGERPLAALTFDDGYRDNYTDAFPLLRRFGFPATIFVATGLIGTSYRGQPMLTRLEIREMSEAGIEFGAHTVHHRILSRLTPAEAAREIAESKAQIEAITGRPAFAFAYPNGRSGDFSEIHVAAVREAGFECALTTLHGANRRDTDLFRLRRVGLGNWGASELALRMSGVLDFAICAKQGVQAWSRQLRTGAMVWWPRHELGRERG